MIVIDFETEMIKPWPDYPPRPVGVAVFGDEFTEPTYFAWGHCSGNNCQPHEARAVIRELWARAREGRTRLVFYNAKFDLAVASQFAGSWPPWNAVDDVMFLAWLYDPHARKLDLKSVARAILDMDVSEVDDLVSYASAHKAELGLKGIINQNTVKNIMHKLPAEVVAPYAIKDVVMTSELYRYLMPIIIDEGMLEAYKRELRVLPIFYENEKKGIRVDREGIEKALKKAARSMHIVENFLSYKLDVEDVNWNSAKQVGELFLKRDVIEGWAKSWTSTGQLAISKKRLPISSFADKEVGLAWGYRQRLKTAMNFLKQWNAQAQYDGRIHTQWNQVHGEFGGTRTGRPSSTSPNFLNIPKQWEGRSDGYEHPSFINGLEPLPLLRKFILPEEGHLWLHRDFSGQELRILAEYEQGSLFRAYLEDPDLDPHGWVRDKILDMLGVELDRTTVKGLNFQAIYGGGVRAAAEMLGCSMDEAEKYKNFHDKALPGRRLLNEEIMRIILRGEAVYTLGGRRYYVEPPKVVGDQVKTFEYKLINYLCQGSAADMTKECLACWYEAFGDDLDVSFLVTVYDEINISAVEDNAGYYMDALKEIMETSFKMKVPVRSGGKAGPNWGELEEV